MARKKQETLVLFPEVAASTRKMTDAQFGALMRAVFAYRFGGEDYEGDDLAIDISFRIVAGQIDRYREVCDTNRANAKTEVQRNPAESSETQQNDPPIPIPYPSPIPSPFPSPDRIPDPVPSSNNEREAGKPATHTRFVPPNVNEVREFCQEMGYPSVDPERFVNFYQSKGWMIGKSPMKDWKAAVRGWSGGEKKENRKSSLGYEPGELWTL